MKMTTSVKMRNAAVPIELPCLPRPVVMPRAVGCLDARERKSAPAHKNQDAEQAEKVPPYSRSPFRWAGVILCIAGLTSFLVSHLGA